MTLRRFKLLPSTAADYERGDPSGPVPVIEIDDQTGNIYIARTKIPNSGNSFPVQTATVPLSATQIKSWTALPIQIVDPPGAGKVLIPSQVVAQYVKGTVDFTDPGGHAGFNLFYGSVPATAYSFKEAGADTFFGGGDGSNISALIQDGESGFGWTLVSVASGYLTPQSYFSNAPIFVGNIDPLATDYGAGDGTLTVTVYYTIVVLS